MHIEAFPPDGGLKLHSCIQCDQPRCVSRKRLVDRIGCVCRETMEQVEDRLRAALPGIVDATIHVEPDGDPVEPH